VGGEGWGRGELAHRCAQEERTEKTEHEHEDISVELRLNEAGKGKAKTFADVTIVLGGDGIAKIHCYAVYHDGNHKARVFTASASGQQALFRRGDASRKDLGPGRAGDLG
jgi:hypothetical protein